jgi:hypothetical protein
MKHACNAGVAQACLLLQGVRLHVSSALAAPHCPAPAVQQGGSRPAAVPHAFLSGLLHVSCRRQQDAAGFIGALTVVAGIQAWEVSAGRLQRRRRSTERGSGCRNRGGTATPLPRADHAGPDLISCTVSSSAGPSRQSGCIACARASVVGCSPPPPPSRGRFSVCGGE